MFNDTSSFHMWNNSNLIWNKQKRKRYLICDYGSMKRCLWDLWPWYNSMIEEPTQRRWKYFWLLQGTQSVTIIQAKSKITKCMWCLSKMIVCFRDELEYTVHLQQAKDVSREFLYSNSDTFLTRRWFATNVANDLTAHVTSHVGHHFKHEFAFSFAV